MHMHWLYVSYPVRRFTPFHQHTGEYELSGRMRDPDNLWHRIWRESLPVPARRQRPLFDATAEVERALTDMESLTMQELARQLFPCLLEEVFTQLQGPFVRAFVRVARSKPSYPQFRRHLRRVFAHCPYSALSLLFDRLLSLFRRPVRFLLPTHRPCLASDSLSCLLQLLLCVCVQARWMVDQVHPAWSRSTPA